MKIVYLLGNGFDINLGLETGFRSFYKYYLKQESDDITINTFKAALSENIDKWADLELALGDYAKNFTEETLEDFRNLLFDIQDKLLEYIRSQEKDFALSEKDEQKLCRDLFYPNSYLTAREQLEFNKFESSYTHIDFSVNVISFNYTKSFEKIFSFNGENKQLGTHLYNGNKYPNTLRTVEHIHGTSDGDLILGVNDVTQIKNDALSKNIKLHRVLLKPYMNRSVGSLRDARGLECISDANIICVFGMSLGETDKLWWKKIIDVLIVGKTTHILFSVMNEIPKQRIYLLDEYKESLKNKLLSYANLSTQQRDFILNKIFVCFNSKMFSISDLQQKKGVA